MIAWLDAIKKEFTVVAFRTAPFFSNEPARVMTDNSRLGIGNTSAPIAEDGWVIVKLANK